MPLANDFYRYLRGYRSILPLNVIGASSIIASRFGMLIYTTLRWALSFPQMGDASPYRSRFQQPSIRSWKVIWMQRRELIAGYDIYAAMSLIYLMISPNMSLPPRAFIAGI